VPSRGVRVGGSAGCRLSATRAISHGVSRRSEDHSSKNQDGYWFPSDPCDVFTPCGCSLFEPPPDPKVEDQPPVRFRAPSEICPCSPAPQRHSASSCKSAEDPSRDAASPGLSCPTTHSGPADPRESCDESLRRCVPRAGFGYPLRDLHHRSSRRRSAGAFMGLTLQGVLLERERCPFRGPCPPDVASRPTPRGEIERNRPPSGPCSRDEFVLSPASRGRPVVDTFLGFASPEPSPHPPGLSLVVTTPALASLGGMTSLPTWTTGLRGSNGLAWPVSGLPTLLRFGTLQPS
jgi:hypothetical protein